MLPYKIFSFCVITLLIFSVENAFSLGVNPKSKQFLRETLKKNSTARNQNQANATNKRSSRSKKTSRTTSKRNTSSSSKNKNRNIVYTFPVPKKFQTATMVNVLDGDTIRVILDGSP
jgi:hypothetical protein